MAESDDFEIDQLNKKFSQLLRNSDDFEIEQLIKKFSHLLRNSDEFEIKQLNKKFSQLLGSAQYNEGYIEYIRKTAEKETMKYGEAQFFQRLAAHFVEEIDKYFVDTPILTSTREANRMRIDFFEGVQEKLKLPFVMLLNGSQADGIRNRSDIDIMYCFNDFVVVEAPSKDSPSRNVEIPAGSEGKWVLLMETENCHPCYARLRLHRPASDTRYFDKLFTKVNGTYYLHKEKFIEYAKIKGCYPNMDQYEIHGPAFNVLENTIIGRKDTDYVACIKGDFWPRIARDRTEMSHLGSSDNPQRAKGFVQSMSCVYLVPTSHADSFKPEVEFRISFSVAEKYMHQHWSNDKLKLFLICKLLAKEYLTMDGLKKDSSNQIREFNEGQKPLCSYHIKTMLYWYMEGKTDAEFEDVDIYAAFVRFIKSGFFVYIINQRLPHFFVEDHDIFDGMCEKDFRLYLKNLLANTMGLPDTFSHENRKAVCPEKKIKDLITKRCIELSEIRGEIGTIESYFAYLYAAHESLTCDRFNEASKGMIDVGTSLGMLLGSMVTRCEAVYSMCDALSGSVSNHLRLGLLLESEVKFKQTIRLQEAPIDDYGVLGHAYLALFYYVTDRSEECLQQVQLAFDAYEKCDQQFFHSFSWARIIIPSGKQQMKTFEAQISTISANCLIPPLLADDPMRYLFLLNNTSAPVLLDPIVMLRYFHLRITGRHSRSISREQPMCATVRLHSHMLELIMANYERVQASMEDPNNQSFKPQRIFFWLYHEKNDILVNLLKEEQRIGASDTDYVKILLKQCFDENTRTSTLSRLFPPEDPASRRAHRDLNDWFEIYETSSL